MRYREKYLTAGIKEVKTMAQVSMNKDTSAALGIIIDGLETMRRYVSAGIRVCPSDETMDAINLLRRDGILTEKQWNILTKALRAAHLHNHLPHRTPTRAVTCRSAHRRRTGINVSRIPDIPSSGDANKTLLAQSRYRN